MPEQKRSVFAVDTAPENGKSIIFLIALGVLLFMRRKVGFFNLKYSSQFTAAFGMIALSWLLNLPLVTWLFGYGIARGDRTSLARYALIFLAVAYWQRHQRKAEKWNPDRPHGYSLGVSWFADFLPVREDYVYLYIDPGITALAGALLRYRLGFPLLGLFWVAGAAALYLVEFKLRQQTELNDWGLGDRRKEAERDGEVLKAMTGKGEARPSSRATNGIPTGSDGLEDSIGRRKRERTGMSPEREDDDFNGGD